MFYLLLQLGLGMTHLLRKGVSVHGMIVHEGRKLKGRNGGREQSDVTKEDEGY